MWWRLDGWGPGAVKPRRKEGEWDEGPSLAITAMFFLEFTCVFWLSVSIRKVASEYSFCVLIYIHSCILMMIAFITVNSSLLPLIEGLCTSIPWEFEFSGFRRNRTDDLGINSPLLLPTEPHLHVRSFTFISIYIFSCQTHIEY